MNDVLREIDLFAEFGMHIKKNVKVDYKGDKFLAYAIFHHAQLQRGAATRVKFDYGGNNPLFESFAVSRETCMRIDLTCRNPASRTSSAIPTCSVRRVGLGDQLRPMLAGTRT
ncbi:hypothetical protein ACIG53_20895 [Streptomyces bauhiniae]|uniref:hypothetical protein n=1 Tax=Streptomyces bauhiniae TaxID=2340725 RepID=UPI0037CFD8B2